MKTFNVFYDLKIAYGVLEERCLVVDNCVTKLDAITVYKKFAPENAIFRYVKTPIY